LDAGLVAHVAALNTKIRSGEPGQHMSGAPAQPYVVPVAYARDEDTVLFHGSTASRLFTGLAAGAPTCLTVTLLDGLVVARSAFESSMHYRSVMVLGSSTVVEGVEKTEALRLITEHLMPGRWDDIRPPHAKELAATTVLRLPLDETSVKVSDGQPDDPADDVAGPAWAGTLPLIEHFGAPAAATDLAPGIAVPAYVSTWSR
jgi:nitroimidazol reductase NimA-like FMN-containing flavoprotein (pyridoxamine 5'-phosphate oxidase superfamily)